MSILRSLTVALACFVLLAQQAPAEQPVSAAATALAKLHEGNARFAADQTGANRTNAARRQELTKGQHPFAVVLACADSRVAPEIIFDQGLGDLFVVRVAGNVAEPGVIGSIEYAVEHLHAPLVVVLGHESCGAVEAALAGKPLPGDLGWLIRHVRTGKGDTLSAAVRKNALYQAEELQRRSPVVKELASTQHVQVVPAVYSLSTGKVTWLKPSTPAP